MDGQRLDDLDTPCMLVYESKVRRNCQSMLDRCKKLGVQLRPHMKTHKTVEGGDLMTGGTRRCITVSTLAEAEFYADNGFDDILYAYPICGIPKLRRANALHRRLDAFHVMVDHVEQLHSLWQFIHTSSETAKQWSVFIDVDIGYARTGVNSTSDVGVELAKEISSKPATRLAGVYVHCGHSYYATSAEEIRSIAKEAGQRTSSFSQRLLDIGITCPIVGIGSTPSCSQPPETLPGINEFHPGNYIFYDLMQFWAGSCQRDDIAACVLTRVVSHYPERNQIVIDCGFTALSKQFQPKTDLYGLFVDQPELKLVSTSQELGIVGPSDGEKLDFSKYPIGSQMHILPYHSCAVAGLHAKYHIVNEDGVCSSTWTPCRGW